MSYTTLDGLRDIWRGERGVNCDLLVEEMRERGYAIVRAKDWDALVAFAEAHSVDAGDEEQWIDANENEVTSGTLMALSNWHKERREW